MARDREPLLPEDMDPVAKKATEYAMESTAPPKHYSWIDVTAYVLLCIVLVISSVAAVISITNSIRLENERRCQNRVNTSLRKVAADDRQANDTLFKAVLGHTHLTRAQLDSAYQHYLDQRTSNDAERNKLQSELNGVCK